MRERVDEWELEQLGGAPLDRLYVAIRKDTPPYLVSPDHEGPPNAAEGDRFVLGDHAWDNIVPLAKAEHYTGEKQSEVEALVEEMLYRDVRYRLELVNWVKDGHPIVEEEAFGCSVDACLEAAGIDSDTSFDTPQEAQQVADQLAAQPDENGVAPVFEVVVVE